MDWKIWNPMAIKVYMNGLIVRKVQYVTGRQKQILEGEFKCCHISTFFFFFVFLFATKACWVLPCDGFKACWVLPCDGFKACWVLPCDGFKACWCYLVMDSRPARATL